MRTHRHTFELLVALVTAASVCAIAYRPAREDAELTHRLPEAAPYVTSEAGSYPPPFENYWKDSGHPGQCQSCHRRIFDEWNGSMMANAWRDPTWRGAFLLIARQTSTNGDCAAPDPPDGTRKARHNPFARAGECASQFDVGDGSQRFARAGSLLDGFCSRCHMPSNYVDNVPLHGVAVDRTSGREHGPLATAFDPTSDAGTGIAFATVEAQLRNTDSGKSGVFCAICHSIAETRDTPYHTLARTTSPARPEYVATPGVGPRAELAASQQDTFGVPDPQAPNLGYAIGAGSFRLSPHAIAYPERLGPLAAHPPAPGAPDRYLEGVFKQPIAIEQVDSTRHHGYYHVLLTRAELCSACHDVTNPLPIKNRVGKWAGGFPIERTYTEWLGSRYADRPGNRNFEPAFKRDCQTCHMQQHFGAPGTAQTLYRGDPRVPAPPLSAPVTDDGRERVYFSHHFVGGNSYVPALIGASQDTTGQVAAYPKLSIFSFTSADERSPYHNAYWTDVDRRGTHAQQARLAWDRLRHVVDLDVRGPDHASPGTRAPLAIRVTNSGSGHKFPTGFPEGRVAWLAVHAFDLGTGRELEIHDAAWKRTSRGIGGLTREPMVDPNVPGCEWKLPPGSPDPYAVQFKAVASLGDGCPTLDLAYAHARNLVVNADGLPIDAQGRVIDRRNPQGLPQFRDLDGDGDVFDDAYLSDTRLDPLPLAGASRAFDRYAVVIPTDVIGPIAVTAAVYYQSVEAMAAQKFLGNLADTDLDFRIEPCVLGGLCDGRSSSIEPAAVEGSPPVPMEVRNWVIQVDGVERADRDRADKPERAPLVVATWPAADATNVYRDVVVKVAFSEPVTGVDATRFALFDAKGEQVPAAVDQIGDGVWALFADRVFLDEAQTYTARLSPGVCGVARQDGARCTREARTWRFTIAADARGATGDTRAPEGFASGSFAGRQP